MDTIRLRSSARHLATSRAVVVFVVFVTVLAPIFAGLAVSAGEQGEGALSTLFYVGAVAPAAGMLIALIMLVVVLWRRSRPVLLVDDRVHLPRTGVTFPVAQLAHLQLYSLPGRGTFLVLLPAHVKERVTGDATAVAPYTVRFPAGAEPQPFELVDMIRARVPEVGVDKLGTL